MQKSLEFTTVQISCDTQKSDSQYTKTTVQGEVKNSVYSAVFHHTLSSWITSLTILNFDFSSPIPIVTYMSLLYLSAKSCS